MVWRSDLDGQIGLGPSTTSSALSPGAHTVWLVATDEGGAADSASVAITVEDRPEASDLPYRYERTFEALTFERPTNMEPGPDGERFYLTEQKGLIRTFENDPAASAAPVMLDLTDRVLLEDDHTAEGLLGFALDPDFAQNGTFYVLYTAAGPQGSRSYSPEDTTTGVRSVLARFRASGPTTASAATEQVLLTLDQPYIYHNGGQIAFGPEDGYLYVSFGDGGKWGDPEDRAQDVGSLYGTILRIDPDGTSGEKPYGVPASNPFVGKEGRNEIYAYGLRNVWRFSFDEEGRLWAGDVGQGGYEEVNLIERGKNYGWDHREGQHCFEPKTGCRTEGLTDPVIDYGRGVSGGYSVNGGYLYEGPRLSGLEDTYIYGDHVNTKVWSATPAGQSVSGTRLIAKAPEGSPLYREGRDGGVATFAEGPEGRLYVLGLNGKIYRLASQQ